ncbi:MAG: hypothetical protein ACRED3_15090, partial [Bradyrhizobium sp.]
TLVHDDTVEAYIGSAANVTTSAGPGKNITINAHSTETEAAIGAAGAGSSGNFAFAGAGVINVLTETTRAFVDRSATVNAGGNLTVHADDQTKFVSVAGNLAVSAGAAAGAGAAVAVVSKHTDAFIESNVSSTIGGNIDVKASSKEIITAIGAGIAASGNVAVTVDAAVNVLNVDTRAFIGDDPDDGNASAGAGNVHADGSIAIQADERTELNAIVGVVGFSGSAAITAGAVVTVTNKHTEAFVGSGAILSASGNQAIFAATGHIEPVQSGDGGAQGKIDTGTINSSPNADSLASQGRVVSPGVSNADAPTVADDDGNARPNNPGTSSSMLGGKVELKPFATDQTGVSITATNYDQINGLAAGIAGAGSAAVALSAVVNSINDTTTASVAANAHVTASAGNINISAASDVHHLAVAASLAVSGGGAVAPAVDVTVISNITSASTEAGSVVTASAGNIVVDANAKEDMLLVGFGIAGATVGIGGAVSVLVVNNTTTAKIAGTADAWGNVVVHSTDDTDITIVDGAGGFGLGGAGASVGVISLSKTTEAY